MKPASQEPDATESVPDCPTESTTAGGANYFAALAGVDCSAHIERKGRFSYLSWPFAVAELLHRHPDATWRVHEAEDGVPYVQSPAGVFVKVTVRVNGIDRTQVHPVLDANNRTVAEPDAFQVNASIQRALVKAIALHGLGLYVYAGEDLPADVLTPTRAVAPAARDWLAEIAGCGSISDLQALWADCQAVDALTGPLRTVFTDRAVTLRARTADGGGDAAA
jgi:hypothetical protein